MAKITDRSKVKKEFDIGKKDLAIRSETPSVKLFLLDGSQLSGLLSLTSRETWTSVNVWLVGLTDASDSDDDVGSAIAGMFAEANLEYTSQFFVFTAQGPGWSSQHSLA